MLPLTHRGDKYYAIVNYRRRHGCWPRLSAPRTLNEHLLALRIDGLEEPLRRRISDKYEMKRYVTELLGPGHVPETYSVLATTHDVRTFGYPARCVVKSTHGSKAVFIRYGAHEPVPIERIAAWLKMDHYARSRERNYRGLDRRVIVESFVDFGQGELPPNDYKIFCFSGQPKLIQVDAGRFGRQRRGFFSPDWRRLPFMTNDYEPLEDFSMPANLNAMLEAAAKLSAPVSPLRVDLYSDGSQVIVGELTNCPGGGHLRFNPPVWDAALGRLFTDPAADVEQIAREVGSHALTNNRCSFL